MGRDFSHAAEKKFQQDRRASRRVDRCGAAHFNWVTVHQFTHWLEHCCYQAPGNLEIACLAELSKSALWEMTYRLAEDIFTLVSKCAHQSKLSWKTMNYYEYRTTVIVSCKDSAWLQAAKLTSVAMFVTFDNVRFVLCCTSTAFIELQLCVNGVNLYQFT